MLSCYFLGYLSQCYFPICDLDVSPPKQTQNLETPKTENCMGSARYPRSAKTDHNKPIQNLVTQNSQTNPKLAHPVGFAKKIHWT